MEKESKDADTVQVVVAIRSWATFKSEKTEKPPCQVSRHGGFSLKTALVREGTCGCFKRFRSCPPSISRGPLRCRKQSAEATHPIPKAMRIT